MSKPEPSADVLAIQSITLQPQLPGLPIPYWIPNDEGERWLLAGMVMNILARPVDNNQQYEIVTWTGGRDAGLPLHAHQQAQQALYLVAGQASLWLNGQHYQLQTGDYVSIPPGCEVAFRCKAHRTRLLHFISGGALTPALCAAAVPWAGYIQPAGIAAPLSVAQKQTIARLTALRWAEDSWPTTWPAAGAVSALPDGRRPYVLANGEGDRYIAGDQVFTYLTDATTSGQSFLAVMTEGPPGNMVPPHFHAQHSEIFFPLDGQVTMIANQQTLIAGPGDAVFVAPGTIHGYQLNSGYTRFIGFLTPGVFDNFFRLLGDPWSETVYPQEPGPLRFDRVLARLDELDLYLYSPGFRR
ncbi:Quercetin 2%2C3-dioxygenase [Klebsiella pneumoniae]|uniref:quercetin 2,3-dioxygenase n=1 Tax=Klebsiella pneumoniae TaxID=573 RepID=UPI0007CBE975|nr:quercetin 2,3-dioxygenase [Klebsiella pneumoniae]SAU96042.1 Quercetin 2%2C3-dioxygenase [Klebsiella pneumoniae]